MNVFFGATGTTDLFLLRRSRQRLGLKISLAALGMIAALFIAPSAFAQDAATAPVKETDAAKMSDTAEAEEKKPAPEKPGGQKYLPAIELLPKSVAALVRIPNMPRFCTAFEKTHVGRLIEEESMQPFIEAQRARTKNYLESIDNKIGIRFQDLHDIASGEAVISWLPFENDKRRPFAICVIADIRGNQKKALSSIDQIHEDLKAGGWVPSTVEYQGQTVRLYNTKPKPGQLKIEQIAITINEERVIAADRDSVVTDLLDAIAGKPKNEPVSKSAEFKNVLTKSSRSIREPVKSGGGTIAAEWFAKPFQVGRILRTSFDIDRKNQVDVIKLLENQGFDALKAAGGIFAIAGKKYDLIHRGFVLAPKPFQKAALMLQLENKPLKPIPAWIHADTASFNRLNLNIENAFWASESLINEAFGDEIFHDIIDDIRDDEDGPQIDIAKNVLPNLDNEIILLTDNTVPAEPNSERMLVAIRVKDGAKIKTAIRKAMEVEPDATKLEVLEGTEIWQVKRSEGVNDLDAELFGDLELDFEDEEDEEEAPPLLDHWAIGLIEQGPGSTAPYLIFSSPPEFLVESAKMIQNAGKGLADEPSTKAVYDSLKELGVAKPAFDRMVRTKLSLRAKYQLLRQGKLRESDSLLATLAKRILEDEDGGQPDPLNAAKLPPLKQIEEFLPDGGSFIESTDEGWSVTGFLLK